jgi:hypothetical protein
MSIVSAGESDRRATATARRRSRRSDFACEDQEVAVAGEVSFFELGVKHPAQDSSFGLHEPPA